MTRFDLKPLLVAGVATAFLASGPAWAVGESTYEVTLEPGNQSQCLEEVEKLQEALTAAAGHGIETAIASEAKEACMAGNTAEAQRLLNESYAELSKNLSGSPASD